jgi:hypothetical protein
MTGMDGKVGPIICFRPKFIHPSHERIFQVAGIIMSVSFVDTDTVNDVTVAVATVPLTEPDITTFCKASALKYCPTTVTVAPGATEARVDDRTTGGKDTSLWMAFPITLNIPLESTDCKVGSFATVHIADDGTGRPGSGDTVELRSKRC